MAVSQKTVTLTLKKEVEKEESDLEEMTLTSNLSQAQNSSQLRYHLKICRMQHTL